MYDDETVPCVSSGFGITVMVFHLKIVNRKQNTLNHHSVFAYYSVAVKETLDLQSMTDEDERQKVQKLDLLPRIFGAQKVLPSK